MSETLHRSLIILGSGPAGYTAAVYAARAHAWALAGDAPRRDGTREDWLIGDTDGEARVFEHLLRPLNAKPHHAGHGLEIALHRALKQRSREPFNIDAVHRLSHERPPGGCGKAPTVHLVVPASIDPHVQHGNQALDVTHRHRGG